MAADYLIRNVKEEDLERVCEIERECFPAGEAASEEQFRQRIRAFGSHFYVLQYEGELIGFINGMVTDENTISDEMYSESRRHDENGRWQTVFGLDVVGKFRRKGYASLLMKELIQKAKEENRQGVTLTCKAGLIPFYEKFGFRGKGKSKSVHGGAVWYDMILEFG